MYLTLHNYILKLCSATIDLKLDGVGPGDNRPSTDKLHNNKTKNIAKTKQNKNMLYMTCEM